MESQEIVIDNEDKYMESQEIVIDNEDKYDVDINNSDMVYVNTSNYEKLRNKPQINNVVLIGNKSLDDLDIQPKGDYPENKITNTELEEIFKSW